MSSRTDRLAEPIGECRRCRTFCDKLVDPGGCIEIGCPFLYSYADPFTGRTFAGCVQKVFKVEIDLEMLEEARHTRAGFGGVKMTGRPLPHCPFTVEEAYAGEGADFECVNNRFADCTEDGPEGLRVFDLREMAKD